MPVGSMISGIRKVVRGRKFRELYPAADFVDLDGIREFRGDKFPSGPPTAWLDRPDAQTEIDAKLKAGEIDETQAQACRFWIENGYLIVPGLIDDATLDAAWAAYEKALADGVLGELVYVSPSRSLVDRKLDPHMQVPAIRALQRHPAMLKWSDLLFGRKTIPFQTIMGHAGSQQAAHSDSIHMTTYPLGYLIANWTAFEDIGPDSGPLEYYPGSHRLPYLLSSDVGITAREFRQIGYAVYSERYEPAIRQICESAGLEKQVFLAKRGDVLFWHANLIHGGTPRLDPERSRKALVCHYFAEGVVTYHDLNGNPSRLHAKGMYSPIRA
jgi:hypothetical protein